MLKFISRAVVATLIAMLILFSLEIGLRAFWPQFSTTKILHGSLAAQLDREGHLFPQPTTLFHSGREFSVEYSINSRGFRDESWPPPMRAKSRLRILVLGDSLAFGYGNDYNDIFAVVAERRLVKRGFDVEFLKAGRPGYGPTDEVRLLHQLIGVYTPDLVIICFFTNDLLDNLPLDLEDLRQRESSTAERLTLGEVQAEQHCNLWSITRHIRDSSHLLRLCLRTAKQNDHMFLKLSALSPANSIYFVSPEVLVNQFQITKRLFLQARQFCTAVSARLVVFSLPDQFQVIWGAGNQHQDSPDVHVMDRILGNFAKQNDFVWISLLSEMAAKYRSDRKPLFFRDDGHPNQEGHLFIGNFLSRELTTILGGASR